MRGRPTGQMTQRRRQVLQTYAEMVSEGERVRLAELARRCGLYSYREARRTLNDLKRMLDIGRDGRDGGVDCPVRCVGNEDAVSHGTASNGSR